MKPTAHPFRAACALAALAVAPPVLAQTRDPVASYPNRPVRLVVPFGSGSGLDIRARQLGQNLSENRPQSSSL